MRTAVPLAALLVLAALAGCSALSEEPRTAAPTLTPVPVDGGGTPVASDGPDAATPIPPTATRTPARTPYALPNGYNATGVENPQVASLVAQQAFENRSNYRLTVRSSLGDGGPRTEIRRLVDEDARLVERYVNGSLDLAVYETDDTVYGYRTDPESDRFRLRSRYVTVSGPVEDRQAFDVLSALRYNQGYASTVIFTGDWGAVGVLERGNDSLLDYRATRPTVERADGVTELEYESRLVVDREGLVRFAGVRSLVRTDDGDRVEQVYSAEVTDLGETDVDRPSWVGEAAHANVTTREGYAVVENVGERAIPLSTAEVDEADSGYGTSLNGTLAPGERLYVSADPETASYRFTREPPEPGSYEPMDGTVTVTLGDESVSVILGAQFENE